MEGLTARRIALKVIRKVTEDGAYAALALDGELKGCGLGNADRRLVSRLTYDTLDHLIYLDWALGQVMAKPDTDIKLINASRRMSDPAGRPDSGKRCDQSVRAVMCRTRNAGTERRVQWYSEESYPKKRGTEAA